MKGKTNLYSIKNSYKIKPTNNTHSVSLHIINKSIKEKLISFSKQTNFNYISIKYKRLIYWLKRGVSLDYTNFYHIEKILDPKNKIKLKKK